ncbi:4'-phosphopantetheinyl transferase family protein [Actinomycetota bacterium Odt1-20B]
MRRSLSRLTPPERTRAQRLRPTDRRDFVAGHLLVRECAAAVLGAPPRSLEVTQQCAHCGGPHGKPLLPRAPALHLSLSHCPGRVAAAAAWEPIGVDVEPLPQGTHWHRAAARALTPRERAAVDASTDPARAFVRQWVRKEAFVKAGEARLGGLRKLDLSGLPVEPRAGVHLALWGEWHVLDWAEEWGSGAVVCRSEPRLGPDPVVVGARETVGLCRR